MTAGARVLISVLVGLITATVVSVIAALSAVLGGGGLIARMGYTLPGLIAMYLVAGIALGAVVGVLLPLARKSSWGAIVVGAIAGAPLYAAFALPSESVETWLGYLPWYVAFGSVGGAIAGPWIRKSMLNGSRAHSTQRGPE